MGSHFTSTDAFRQIVDNAKLPDKADKHCLAKGSHEAAAIYMREVAEPTPKELHKEIKTLYDAAMKQQYEQAALLRKQLSAKTRGSLNDRADRIGLTLPSPEDLCDSARRDEACATIAKLCRIGGDWIEGRKRPFGKRSATTCKPLLCAPSGPPELAALKHRSPRNFSKRDAERNLVMWLGLAWLEATGVPPPRTADRRNLGPFARLVREVLQLASGQNHSESAVAERINELNTRRRKMEARLPGSQVFD
jgi:hypothetical protein